MQIDAVECLDHFCIRPLQRCFKFMGGLDLFHFRRVRCFPTRKTDQRTKGRDHMVQPLTDFQVFQQPRVLMKRLPMCGIGPNLMLRKVVQHFGVECSEVHSLRSTMAYERVCLCG
jgi:hypothetical protein